jgi:hypothetical protein
MIQPSIHKRDIGIEPHRCVRGVVRHARFSPNARARSRRGNGGRRRSGDASARRGAYAVGRLRLIVQAATFPSPRSALLRITDSQLGHRARSEKCHYRKQPRFFDGADEHLTRKTAGIAVEKNVPHADHCATKARMADRASHSRTDPFLCAALSAYMRVITDVAIFRRQCADARR